MTPPIPYRCTERVPSALCNGAQDDDRPACKRPLSHKGPHASSRNLRGVGTIKWVWRTGTKSEKVPPEVVIPVPVSTYSKNIGRVRDALCHDACAASTSLIHLDGCPFAGLVR